MVLFQLARKKKQKKHTNKQRIDRHYLRFSVQQLRQSDFIFIALVSSKRKPVFSYTLIIGDECFLLKLLQTY